MSIFAQSSQLGAHRQCVRDWSGILCGAQRSKDRAESPTRSGTPKKETQKFRTLESQNLLRVLTYCSFRSYSVRYSRYVDTKHIPILRSLRLCEITSQKKSFPNLPFSQKKCVVLERCFDVLISLKISIGTSRLKSKFCHCLAEVVFIFAHYFLHKRSLYVFDIRHRDHRSTAR